jgi:hypothetical protein
MPSKTVHTLLALALALGVVPGLVSPQRSLAAPATSGAIASVSVTAPDWIATGVGVTSSVHVDLGTSVTSLSVRISLNDDRGARMWVRTQTTARLSAGPHTFTFTRAGSPALPHGVYTARVDVSAPGATPASRTSTMVIADPATSPLPVSVVIRVAGVPEIVPGGTSATSPDTDRTRSEATALAMLAVARPQFRLTAAVAPYLLDEWAAAGAGGAGSGSQTTTSASAAAALDGLSAAVSGGMPLLRGAYSDPDLVGLASTGTPRRDVVDQLALGSAVTSQTLSHATEATGVAVLGDVFPAATGSALVFGRVRFALLDPTSVRTAGSTSVSPGLYRLADGVSASAHELHVVGVVLDTTAATLLDATDGGRALAAYLYSRAASQAHGGTPAVIEVVVGPGRGSVNALEPALQRLSTLPWVHLETAPEIAGRKATARAALTASPREAGPGAPAGYWDRIRTALVNVRAFASAVGTSDPEAQRAFKDVFLAESRAWAGPDGAWVLADSGAAFADAGGRIATRVLSAVSVTAPSVTLSGNAGRLPISIVNGSAKMLTVTVRLSSPTIRVKQQQMFVKLKPGENIVSLPVDLGTALAGTMGIQVLAGRMTIASTKATLKATYLDRLVLVIAVVMVLAGLLLYVRKRARRTATVSHPAHSRSHARHRR